MTFPLTIALPAAISTSASLREHIPELEMYLFSRMPSASVFNCF